MREALIQQAIVDYLIACVPGLEVWAVPMASRRTHTGRATNAVSGLRKGVFDLSLILPDGRFACIEVKTEAGKLSPDQIAFQVMLMRKGIPYCVARGIDDVRFFLDQCNVKTREAR